MHIAIKTTIAAPPEVVFDLARDMDFHVQSLAHTGERAVGGVMAGLIALGESVTFEARHLGVTQRLTTRITAFDRPCHFRDEMTRGAFARFIHDHHFDAKGAGTTIRDVIDFASPLGPVGWVFDQVYLGRYMRRLLTHRAEAIKAEAERRCG